MGSKVILAPPHRLAVSVGSCKYYIVGTNTHTYTVTSKLWESKCRVSHLLSIFLGGVGLRVLFKGSMGISSKGVGWDSNQQPSNQKPKPLSHTPSI